MKRLPIFIAALGTLSLCGVGCFHVGPRIVKTPGVSSDDAQVAVGGSNPPVDATALAYLKLNAGSANVVRSSQTSAAKDGEAILSGDEVDVTSGVVSLIYPEAGESQLSENAHVVVLPQGDQKEGTVSEEVQLLVGNIWTRFERELGSSEQFNVNSNGVVATVRGTAFGVSNDGTNIDVQVAQNTVWVSSEDSNGSASQAVTVTQGQALKLNKVVAKASLADMSAKNFLRILTSTEKSSASFQFGVTPISVLRLRKPDAIFQLNIQPSMPVQFRPRVEILRSQMLERLRLLKFGVPTSSPALHIDTKATFYINGVAQ